MVLKRMSLFNLRILSLSLLCVFGLIPGPKASADSEEQQTATRNRGWQSAAGGNLPFVEDADVLSFLAEADVVSIKELTTGINRPLKMSLRQGDVEANAIFRVVEIRSKRAYLDGRIVSDFQDSFIFECAAYQFSRLLGLENVPPCVRRRYKGKIGTLQLWIEGAQTESERRAEGLPLLDQMKWLRDKQTMRIFDVLISNFDRNQGNMLTDQSGKLWFIDHTRAFRNSSSIENADKIVWCSKNLWQRIHHLEKKSLAQNLSPYLTPRQIAMILKRRDKLVEVLDARIRRLGEGSVLYEENESSHGDSLALKDLELDDDMPETSSQLIVERNR